MAISLRPETSFLWAILIPEDPTHAAKTSGNMRAQDMSVPTPPTLAFNVDPKSGKCALSGELSLHTVTQAQAFFRAQSGLKAVDIAALTRLDTAGAWFLLTQSVQGAAFAVTGASETAQSLLKTVAAAMPQPEAPLAKAPFVQAKLAEFGERVFSGVSYLYDITGFFGIVLHRIFRAIRHPKEFRFTALVHHCEEVGVKAVPIVALMAFLIGVVLAFQGSTQLRQFGAEVFVVDLIAISVLRELGILLTAIIVAGRTASAFTAAIGSMKMREEIDAMRTLGLDPAMVLFVPRILALLVMLPILGLIADVAGLFGGALMAWIDLGISPQMFTTRLVSGTGVNHVYTGLVKAPFFALIIGIVGCHAGMQVESNAESLGRMTSNAVVAAIFAVIVADAIFSIFFARLGI